MSKYQVEAHNTHKILDWIQNRCGIAIWESINLSNPAGSWTSPVRDANGVVSTKPNWQCSNTPERVITDIKDVEVITPREVGRFHVGVKRSGMKVVLTDGASRKVRAAVDKAGDNAWYGLDYVNQEAVIYVPGEVVGLEEWAAQMAGVSA